MRVSVVTAWESSRYLWIWWGTKIYGTKHVLWQLSAHYPITAEQLFYELNIILKYFTIIPAVFIFVVTTNPSEFAASLNRIGISYNIGYAVAIALRYIPDVQDDFHKIKNAQEARGYSVFLTDYMRQTAHLQ